MKILKMPDRNTEIGEEKIVVSFFSKNVTSPIQINKLKKRYLIF